MSNMKLKYLLKKTINIKSSYLILLIVGMLVVIGGCVSYAIFTVTSESKGVLNIVTGNLYSYIDSIDLDKNKSVTVAPGDVTTVTLKLLNVNGIDAKLNLYYSTTSANIDIGYLVSGDAAPTTDGYVLGKNGSDSESKTIYVQIKNNDSAAAVVTFGSDVGLSTATLAFPSGKSSLSRINNNYISNIYNYDDKNEATKCITGEEETCQVSNCIDDTDKNSCDAGTIVKYKINNEEEKFFYVLHDDGNKLVLQQRENTLENNVSWSDEVNESGNPVSTGGPVTALKALEEKTQSWANVDKQTYTMGTTDFNGTNAFTGCTVDTSEIQCDTNTYTLENKTVRARMITVQEATTLGCSKNNQSCPLWMSNYLKDSTSYGGTVNDELSSGYYTMNAGYYKNSSLSTGLSYFITYYGNAATNYSTGWGTLSDKTIISNVRAVVEVSK